MTKILFFVIHGAYAPIITIEGVIPPSPRRW